ncbi:NACHT domain-containing protein [Streptomyces decoyicus]|uniref:NACHT domain-containing protein n=1 Tax=Streptomyces decoyicus TaxID=249567 RepID=A0ABZ1FNV6_9ACTN|nr:NACHT domain-containing protein [Streptomyces decoyicus]WSB71657.1 NACHT domain-containing protein [Streptomyces decoyicus]
MNPVGSRAAEPDGLDAGRVVQVLTTRRAGPGRRGSGYQVSGHAVLTAAHVVSEAVSVRLRFFTEDGGTTELPAEPVWADEAMDIAVLEIARESTGESARDAGAGEASAGGPGRDEVPPVRFAGITRPVECEAVGFPRFRLRLDTASADRDDPPWYRDSHHARGTTTPLSYLRAGSLEISVAPPEYDPEPGRSPWEGMSGAAVWSGGYVIGVVSEHHRFDGLGRFAASQVKRWYRLAPDRIGVLSDLIGLPADAGRLPRLPLPSPPRPPETPEPDEAPEVQEAAGKLARDVYEQWRREGQWQQVGDRFPLAVRFGCTERNVFDHWANIRRAPFGTVSEPLPLDGRLDRIVEVYESVPSRRLVVLGEAGSGKTVLTLRFVLDRLRARAAGDRMPVIFGLGAWDPATTSLDDWLCGQLVRDYPFLEAPAGHGGNLAGLLLDEDRILPVLDGFDEIASGLHGAALRALNRTTMPLLLTSRPAEYSRAVEDNSVLSEAAVIELADLTVDDYAEYLHRGSRPVREGGEDSTAWDPVLTRLRNEPDGPGAANVAKVLATPLMVALARTVYGGTPGHRPSELLDVGKFASPEALQDHLLAAFIPAVYDPTPTGRGTSRRRRRHPERVQRWLGYLAAHLHELDTRDLAWWELGTTMRLSSRMLVVGFLAALAFGVTTGIGNVPVDLVATEHGLGFALGRGLMVGLLHGLLVGLVFGFVYGFVSGGAPREPSRVRLQLFGGTRQSRARFVRRSLLGLGFGVLVALALVLVDRCVVAPLGFDDGLDGGLVGAILFPLELGLGAGLVLGIMAWLEAPIEIRSAVSASDLLSTNRKNVVFHMLVWMLVIGLPAGLGFGLLSGPVGGLMPGPVRGLLAGLVFGIEAAFGGGLGYGLSFTAWGQWVALARMWLPLTGRLPWAVIAFLDDAHRRGVLRQAGAVYQFRHARLQDHLTQVSQPHHASRRSGSAGRAGRAGPEHTGNCPGPEERLESGNTRQSRTDGAHGGTTHGGAKWLPGAGWEGQG